MDGELGELDLTELSTNLTNTTVRRTADAVHAGRHSVGGSDTSHGS